MSTSFRRLALKARVVLETSAHLSSQYLCGTARPSTSHVVHDVQIRDIDGSMRTIKALVDCGASSLFISQRLVDSLGFRNQTRPAYITTRGLDGTIMARAKDSRKLSLELQYMPHLAPVDEPDFLVVKMKPYDLVLGLPWFAKHGPEIDWVQKRLISLRNAESLDLRKVPTGSRDQFGSGGTDSTPAVDLKPVGKSLVDDTISASEPLMSRTVSGIAAESRTVTGRSADADEQARAIRRAPSIEILSATQFESLLASTEVISSAFALRIWQGTGLLGGTRLDCQEFDQRFAGMGSTWLPVLSDLIVVIHGVRVVGVAAAEADRWTRYVTSL